VSGDGENYGTVYWYECERCGHKWEVAEAASRFQRCPECRTVNEERYTTREWLG